MSQLGTIIKNKRKEKGLSLRKFAELCGISHTYIKNLEDGDPKTGKEVFPTINILSKISSALSISVQTLISLSGFYTDENESIYKIDSEIINFVSDPDNIEYIQLAKELKNKSIDIKSLRTKLLKED